jgi:hypothetical protein
MHPPLLRRSGLPFPNCIKIKMTRRRSVLTTAIT